MNFINYFILFLLTLVPLIHAESYLVTSSSDLENVSKQLLPGDKITMKDGIWNDQYLHFNANGTIDKPIIMEPQTCGGVHLTGRSRLDISGNWLKVSCVVFENGQLGHGQHIVRFNGLNGKSANSEFSNSIIRNYSTKNEKDRLFWVSLFGHDNKVMHNLFEGQNHSGVTVVVWSENGKPDNHLIKGNIFKDRKQGIGNGYESIRVGSTGVELNPSGTQILSNLFERTDGELETISIKTSNVKVNENIFREVAGTVTLRQGENNEVKDNVFCGNHKRGSGGIRVMGSGHVISNNLFYGMSNRVKGQIALYCGEVDMKSGGTPSAKNIKINNNFFVDGRVYAIDLETGCGTLNRVIPPKNITITDNVSFASQSSKKIINETSNIEENDMIQRNIFLRNNNNNKDRNEQINQILDICQQPNIFRKYGPIY